MNPSRLYRVVEISCSFQHEKEISNQRRTRSLQFYRVRLTILSILSALGNFYQTNYSLLHWFGLFLYFSFSTSIFSSVFLSVDHLFFRKWAAFDNTFLPFLG